MKTHILLAIILFVCLKSNFVFAEETNNVFKYKLGTTELYSLSEGERLGSSNILINATKEMLANALPDGNFTTGTNAFFIRLNGKNILIDAGHGINLFDNLQKLKVSAEQIDIILITHCHGDHINGLQRNGKESFPNATIYMAEKEYNYWIGDNSKNTESRFENVRKIIVSYKNRNRVKLFTPDEINSATNMFLPNIQAIALYGHTPGHTGFMISSGNDKIFIWADLTHCTPVQMLYPNVSVSFDYDSNMAAEVRKKALKYISKNKIPVAGSHISNPGMGWVKEKTESYNFYPIN